MVGVVPVPQVLQHQDEVGGVLVHSNRMYDRCAQRCAAGNVSVERDFSRVTTQHLHRVPGLGLGRQLDDHTVRHALTRQVRSVQLR